MAAEGRTRRLDRAVAALAERQHGVVALVQLARLGMSRDELRTRVAAGRLHRLHRGVYAVVAPRLLRIEGHWLAAVFAVPNPTGAARRPRPSTTRTRTPPEEQFLAICDRAGLPRPECNVPFTLPDGTEISIDAFWRSAALAVEVDSRGFHSNWRAQVKDRRRDAQLVLAGIKTLRFTEADLTRDAKTTIAILRALLTLAPPPTEAAPPRARR